MNENEYRSDVASDIELLSEDSFEKLRSKNQNKKIRRRIGYVFVVLLIVAVFVIASMYFFLKVKNITVEGNTKYEESGIIDASGVKEGMNLFSVDKKEAAEKVSRKYAYFKSVDVYRELPSTINIKVEEDAPFYVADICGETFVFSKTMRVLEKIAAEEKDAVIESGILYIKLPTVKYAIVGDKLGFENDLTFEYVEKLINGLTESGLEGRLTEIDVSNKYHIYLNYEGRFRVYIGDNNDVPTKVRFASMIISNFEADRRGEVDAHDISVGSVILEER